MRRSSGKGKPRARRRRREGVTAVRVPSFCFVSVFIFISCFLRDLRRCFAFFCFVYSIFVYFDANDGLVFCRKTKQESKESESLRDAHLKMPIRLYGC